MLTALVSKLEAVSPMPQRSLSCPLMATAVGRLCGADSEQIKFTQLNRWMTQKLGAVFTYLQVHLYYLRYCRPYRQGVLQHRQAFQPHMASAAVQQPLTLPEAPRLLVFCGVYVHK